MALPKVNTPTYELAVPSTDDKIKFRPFLVKEEKILLIAMEAQEQSGILSAVKDIVQSCTFDKLEVSKAPIFDIEYIFLNIRAKSVGEVSAVNLRCPDDNETFALTEIDLTEVEVQINKKHTNKIELTDEMGMIMTYPTLESFKDNSINITASNMIDVIATCVSQIYDKKGEELNSQQFKEVQKFFDTMPKLTHTVTVENPKTKVKSDVVLTGLNDFFG